VARRRQPAGRKRRTREHVIADLGVNFVERAVLECGYSVERKRADYGIDLLMDTYDGRGEVENGQIKIQVKATDAIARTADGEAVTQRVAVADLKAWLFDREPVVIVVYDAHADVAYWLDVQEYARAVGVDIGNARTVSLRIPVANLWSRDAVRHLRVAKNRLEDLYRRFRGGR
jgi:hypothetical protein